MSLSKISTVVLPMMASLVFAECAWGRDTVFLSMEVRHGNPHAVFVDPDPHSRQYRKLTNFSMDDFEAESYRNSLEGMRERGLKMGKVQNLLPWKEWVPLVTYQGKWHVYKPCDFLFHSQWSVTDTTVIGWTGEGPSAVKLLWQKKVSSSVYRMAYTAGPGPIEELTIHIIDPKKGIAVFQTATNPSDTSYRLMIAAKTIHSVPLIVNHCPHGKQSEFEFESTDPKRYLQPTTP